MSRKKMNRALNVKKIQSSRLPKKENKMATKEQVETIQEFVSLYSSNLMQDMIQAQNLANISASDGRYQPIVSEQYLQQINFNPSKASASQIEDWLLNPQSCSIQLRGMSQYLENCVGQYQKLIKYYSDMLSFNYLISPLENIDEVENKNKYVKSYYEACDIVQKMNVKTKFNNMALTTLQDGVSFWYIVETDSNIGFLQIPTDWCRITSSWNLGWTGEIDLMFFDRMYGLKDMIPELSEAYKVFIEKRKEGLDGDRLAPFQYFPLPIEKSWIFTFDPNKATKVPPLSNTFVASLDVISYRNLLRDQSFLDLWKVIAMKIPTKSNDQLLMTYDEAAKITSMIQANMPDNMTVIATPFEANPINTNQITTLDKTVTMANTNFFTSAGVSGEFFGMETKSAKALQIAQQKDYLYGAKSLYGQFNNMVNWYLLNRIKKYRWKIDFSGNEMERDAEIKSALSLVTTANFPVSYLASKAGLEPAMFEFMTNLENHIGLKDKMKPLQSAFQQSGGQEDGRPKEDIDKITDEGMATRESRGEI